MEKNTSQLSVPQAVIINGIIIGITIIVAGLIVSHALTKEGTPTPPPAAPQSAAAIPGAIDIRNVSTANEPFIGNPNPKVAIAYWCDYQASSCKLFETTAFQDIIKKYVSDKGIAVIFKDFAAFGPDSVTGALYGRAVWQLYPAQYFTWREAMFNAQDRVNQGFGDEASVLKITAAIPGIDATKVQQAVVANKDAYTKAIEADAAEAAGFKINGTPAFITGAKLIMGVTPYETFSSALDEQLK